MILGEHKISVIVRTKNEELWIGKCLSGILKQNLNVYEIIIVDSGSTDNTLKIALLYDKVKIVKIRKYLPGLALNKGIDKAAGDIIVLISAHCIPFDKNWLKFLTRDLLKKNVAGVYGKQLPVSFSDPRDVRDLYITFGDDKRIQKKDSFFHNANSAMKKAVWQQYPFKNDVTNIEDRIWGKEVIENNYNLVYEPKAQVYHYHGIHQSDNIKRVESTVKIINSIDEHNRLNQLPDELHPKNCEIVSLIPIRKGMNSSSKIYSLEHLNKSINESKYIANNYFLCDKSILKNSKITFKHQLLGRPKNDNISLGSLLKWGLNKIYKKNSFPDYIIYINPEYIFRPKNYFDLIIFEIAKKGLNSVFTGYRDFSSYWYYSSDREEYLPVNQELSVRSEKSPLFKSLFGLGSIVLPSLIREKTLVSKENVGIIYSNDIRHTLRANNEISFQIIKKLNG